MALLALALIASACLTPALSRLQPSGREPSVSRGTLQLTASLHRLAFLIIPMALLTGDWSKRPLCPHGQRQITFKIDDDGQSGSWTCGIRLNHWEPHRRQPASHFVGRGGQPDATRTGASRRLATTRISALVCQRFTMSFLRLALRVNSGGDGDEETKQRGGRQ